MKQHLLAKKIFIIFMTLAIVLGPFTPLLNQAIVKASNGVIRGDDIRDAQEEEGVWGDTGEISPPTPEEMEEIRRNAPPAAVVEFALAVNPSDSEDGQTAGQVNPLTVAFESLFLSSGPKIIFSPADAEEIRMLSCINETIPDYANNLWEIHWERPDLPETVLADMQIKQPEAFNALIDELKREREANLAQDLMKPEYRTQLACLLREDTTEQVENRLRDDRAFVERTVNLAIDTLKIDIRVLQMLNYLVTPKNRGGAGHDLIKVYRLRRGFTIPGRQQDDESDAIIANKKAQEQTASDSSDPPLENAYGEESDAQQAGTSAGQVIDGDTVSDFAMAIDDSENQVISAHAEGEAVDIEAVDTIKCTLIKKIRLLPDKKIPQPAKPIELIWQTEEGYDQSAEGQRDTVNSLVSALYKDGLIDLLGELNVDLNNVDDLSGANLGDILNLVGQSLLGQLINTNGQISGSDLSETLKKIGAIYLADKLDLPRLAIYGAGYSNLDDIKANVGRAALEEKLGLTFGSLTGETPEEIFYSIGERKMERQLNLPIGTLTRDIVSERQLMIKIGASLVEDRLYFNRGSFLKPKLEDIRKLAGERKFDIIFAMPEVVDTRLNLEGGESSRFRKGQDSPETYLYNVAAKHLTDYAYIWSQFKNCKPGGIPGTSLNWTSCDSGSQNQRDAVFDVPNGSSDQLLTGQMNALVDVGRWEIAKRMSSRQTERQVLFDWFKTNNSLPPCEVKTNSASQTTLCPPELSGLVLDDSQPGDPESFVTVDESYINTRFGFKPGDFYLIFGASTGGGGAVFANIGAQKLYEAIKNSPDFVREKNEFLADHPEIANLIQKIEFYADRFNDINKHLDNLDKEMEAIKNDRDMAEAYQAYVKIREKIKSRPNSSIDAYRNIARDAKTQFGLLRSRATSSDRFKERIGYVLNEIDQIFYDLQEIISGEDNGRLTDFRFSQFGITSSGSKSKSGVSIQRAMWLLLTGQASVKEVIVYLGGGMIEEQLNLPPNTFHYFVQSLESANKDKPEKTNSWDTNRYGAESYFSGAPDGSFEIQNEAPYGGDLQDNHKYERERFLASLGQAAIEEQMRLLPDSFQGENSPDPATEENLGSVISHIAAGSSVSQAKQDLQSGFSTSASLDRLMSGDSSAWSQARDSFEKFDRSLNLSNGSTQAFMTGVNVRLSSASYLNQEETDLLVARLNIPESALLKLTHVLAGEESWEANPLNYQNFNPYLSNSSTVDANGNCIASSEGNTIYTDQDGSHTFSSREQAVNYFNQHKDRQLDYIGQIALSLSAIPGSNLNAASLNNVLKNYLKDLNNPRALSDEQIARLSEAGGLPSEILQRLFIREDKKSTLFKYLTTVGERVGEQRLRYALLDSFGLSLGGAKFSANDLFDMLNGGAPTTMYRLAGSYVDRQLGVDNGTFARIISAPNDSARLCLMEQAGFSWLFNRLGIRGVQLSGNPYHTIGGGKIETALNWPRGTFSSDSPKGSEDKRTGLIELMDKVGVNKFVKAFKIPLAGLDFRPTAELLFPNDPDVNLGKMTNAQILDRLDDLLSAASLEDTRLLAARDNLTSAVKTRLRFIQDENSIIWKYSETNGQNTSSSSAPLRLDDFTYYDDNPLWGSAIQSMMFKNEILEFQKQVSYLDFSLQLAGDSTKNLLMGKMTPDDYRDTVSNTQIGLLAALKIADLLGVEPAKVNAINDVFQVLLRNRSQTTGADDGAIAWSKFTADERVRLFQSFETIFSLNLDSMAKFREGTFAKIIRHPENAVNVLVREGLYRLDQSLFGKSSSPGIHNFSTEAIYAAYTGDDEGRGFQYRTCDVAHGRITNCYSIRPVGQTGAVTEAASQMSNYVRDKACRGSDGKILSGCLMSTEGTTLFREFLASGNVQFLEALANAEISARINIVLEGTATLPGGFQVTWGDIAGAIFGNRALEQRAADLAQYRALMEIYDPRFAEANTGEADWYDRENGYGITGQVNIGDPDNPYTGRIVQQSSPRDIATMVDRNLRSAYSVPDGSPTLATLQQQYLIPPDLSDSARYGAPFDDGLPASVEGRNLYYADLGAYYARRQQVEVAQSQARDHVRQSYLKNIEYHYIDSMLFQKDPNIPPGFASAMLAGNNKTRADALLAWLRNGVLSGKAFGIDINPILGNVLIYAADTLQWGDDVAFGEFVTTGRINQLDTLLREKFKDIIGIDLAAGTFGAIFAGWRNGGNFSQDYTFVYNGREISLTSLENVYKEYFAKKITAWLDKMLGFDIGSVYKIYTMYKGYESARSAYSLAVVAHTTAVATVAHLESIGITIDPASAVAQAPAITQAAKDKAKVNMAQLKAAMITFIVTTLFSKQLAQMDAALGLVPGSAAALVGIGVQFFFPMLGVPWLAIAMFVLMNLFGVYKIEMKCTADGYYPGIQKAPDPNVKDNGGLGVFDGLNAATKKKEFVRAAQYKARVLLGDVLAMPERFDDQRMTPSQIMTGRKEDVDYWFPKTAEVIYKFTGLPDANGELPSRAGLWQNPQTTAYTHIGF